VLNGDAPDWTFSLFEVLINGSYFPALSRVWECCGSTFSGNVSTAERLGTRAIVANQKKTEEHLSAVGKESPVKMCIVTVGRNDNEASLS
jgi:hypothetical protein